MNLTKTLHSLFKVIFWVWNATFLGVVYLWILPFVAIFLVVATFTGEIELEFTLTILALIAVPTICTVIGARYFRQRPVELIRLFYGVEAPLFLFCLVRLFILRELTPASRLVLSTILICVAAFFVELVWGYLGNKQNKTHRFLTGIQLVTHSLMLLVGLYVGIFLFYYAVPLAVILLRQFFSGEWLTFLWQSLTHDLLLSFSIVTILLTGTATLFLGMPSAFVALYIHSGQRIIRNFATQYGRIRTTQIILGTLTLWIILFINFLHQPQVLAFQKLETIPQTDQQKQELLAESQPIRKGLVNAYLSAYRYLGAVKDSNSIERIYKDVFNLPQPLLDTIQNSYNQVMSPFLYQGDLDKDSEKAEKLYADFFDTPIQKGERLAIQHALKSTAILDEAKAGLLNINQQKVWLAKQEVTVQEQGDWGEVEIYEVYQNQTNDVEEIFYSFSLPETAVITGLWLGDTNNKATRFPFTVAPRGAAQKVYNSQVKRERPVDPALLEQVGTQHYRLRAFPIPAKSTSWDRNNSSRPTELHLWLTYKVMGQGNQWPLPKVGEKRNIFWTKSTQRIRNQKRIRGFDKNWLEASLPASKASIQSHEVTLEGYKITAQPLTEKDYSLPQGQQFAIILDTSRSMGNHQQELVKTLDWFKTNVLTKNQADLYITATEGNQPQLIDDLRQFPVNQKAFYGTLQIKEMLRQFMELKGNKSYDGIILISDEGSYELSEDKTGVPQISVPLWIVHLGSLAPAYEDGTLKMIQKNGGGVSTDISEVMKRIATTEQLTQKLVSSPQPKPTVLTVADGYGWFMEKTTEKPTNSQGFEPIAARLLVRGLSQKTSDQQLTELDGIHAIAKTYNIVTPYSSMIVLVNDEQRQALKAAEASADRFNRKIETGKEQLNKPNNPLNNTASVPEPGMVVGLGIIGLFMIVQAQRNKLRSP
ncbi:TIGR02921 family PEP-CTERM protein [Planktothrix mougeotii]|uniref:TIGR02921 family PEP-CTERM protein n=1 Tax=Planktothrix mougeotii LEGE 06226 TaxID=1828728 RepID=A0ABR9U938_9CYAN|nr:TIGR02921 family PEP-CTERM protein [Planktothrix mougeotii]MBE9142124.1 TIGR02921 family PEP-CTERM protein [Planktothrix mougeotii LEGE 06226]